MTLSGHRDKITIFGHKGFIGSYAAQYASEHGYDVLLPKRNEIPKYKLGNVLYCIGLTSDFRSKPLETIEAHVSFLKDVFTHCTYDSFCYLSSTRVYMRCEAKSVREDSFLPVNPIDQSDLYNISKMMGESLCLANKASKCRVVRLSNIYGDNMGEDLFISSILKEALSHKKVKIIQGPGSSKDYLHINDAIRMIFCIIQKGYNRIYNVGYGKNVTHGELASCLQKGGVDVAFESNSIDYVFPEIDQSRFVEEFEVLPHMNICDYLTEFLNKK